MDWIALLQTFGLPVVCLFAMATAIWRVGVWSAREIVKPIADRHIRFLDSLEKAVTSLTETTTKLGQRLDGMDGQLNDIKQVIVRTSNVNIIPEKGVSSDRAGDSSGR